MNPKISTFLFAISIFFIHCEEPDERDIVLKFWRHQLSTKSSDLICTIDSFEVTRIDDNTFEFRISDKDQFECFTNIIPYFGGGIDYVILYNFDKEVVRMKAKAPFSSYNNGYYPQNAPQLLAFKDKQGKLVRDGRFIVQCSGADDPNQCAELLHYYE